jgi:transglutaminase-like putative cysteine protease
VSQTTTDTHPGSLWLAEAGLLGVSLATVVGYGRLFEDASYLAPIALAAVVAQVLALVLRRIGVGAVLALAAELAILPLFLTWTRYGATTTHLLPTSVTLDHVGDDLSRAWDVFVDISAPVPVEPGFVVAAMAAIWVAAVVADGLAFRLDTTVEALAPTTGLFLFASILSGPEHRVASTALFLLAALGFTLAARVARADGSGRWLATDAGRGARALLAAGGTLAAVAILAAVVAGPILPGASGQPIIDLAGHGGDDGRVTISPLVDIRSRLVEQSSLELFTVEAAAPAYWRLTALDDFDGRIWSSSGSYVGVEGRLPQTPDPEPAASRILQTFRIAALAQIWLPAAFEPVTVSSPDADVDWDPDSSSLVVGTGHETSDGLEYSVLSILPRFLPGDLEGGTTGLDEDFYRRFTRLPLQARRVADQYVTEAVGRSRTSAYDQALTLQNWFRDNFDYSLEVGAGHSTDALAGFLDPEFGRVGYCEQFAGAYAAMARSLGLPARVAVGFTPGEEQADHPGTFVVSGRHAHAWPEVYFAGAGWVPFEPTPGRGAPGAEAYTGVPAHQASPTEAAPPTTSPTTPRSGTTPDRPTRIEDFLPDPAAGQGNQGRPDAVTVAGIALLVLTGVWVIGLPLIGWWRRHRLRRAARGHPPLEVTEAWRESVRALAVVDLVPRPAETPGEFARRANAEAGTNWQAHASLAELTTAAVYGSETDEADVDQARAASTVLVTRARQLAGPWRRALAAFSPRSQLRGF